MRKYHVYGVTSSNKRRLVETTGDNTSWAMDNAEKENPGFTSVAVASDYFASRYHEYLEYYTDIIAHYGSFYKFSCHVEETLGEGFTYIEVLGKVLTIEGLSNLCCLLFDIDDGPGYLSFPICLLSDYEIENIFDWLATITETITD